MVAWLAVRAMGLCWAACLLALLLAGVLGRAGGTVLVFAGRSSGISLVDVARGWVQPLPLRGSMPVWSPDGRLLLYLPLDARGFFVFDAASGARYPLFESPAAGSHWNPAWSPDGARLAYAASSDGDFEIYVVAVERDGRARGAPLNITANRDFDNNPTWSPDGRYIAFESNRSGRGTIYIFDTANPAQPVRALTDGQTWAANPAWSPDGARIAYENHLGAQADIFVVNVDGTASYNLTNHPNNDLAPAWSPDSREIAFLSIRNFFRQVYIIEVATGVARAQTQDEGDKEGPAWMP